MSTRASWLPPPSAPTFAHLPRAGYTRAGAVIRFIASPMYSESRNTELLAGASAQPNRGGHLTLTPRAIAARSTVT